MLGLGLSIPQLATRGGRTLTLSQQVAALFANGAQGAWYDPSDITTLYQDSAGTTPVTAMEQPVGLILDKSKGLVLGPELNTLPASWTVQTGWVNSSGGVYTATNTDTAVYFNFVRPANSLIEVSLTISNYVSGTLVISSRGNVSASFSGNGVKTIRFLIGSTADSNIYIDANTPFTGAISGISVRELPGNHAFQSTSASRPVLSARYNLLTKTEQFDDAAWFKSNSSVTANATTAPDGTLTADKLIPAAASVIGRTQQNYTGSAGTTYTLSVYAKQGEFSALRLYSDDNASNIASVYFNLISGAITTGPSVSGTWTGVSATSTPINAGWYRFTLTWTATGAAPVRVQFWNPNTGDGTSGIYIWGASLVPANQASLPYQRVNTATDYDTAGFPAYLKFDGIDDSLVTNSIDFTATDKMTVCAGVRKLSDSQRGVLLELSATYANNGTFAIEWHSVTLQDYQFVSTGTTIRAASSPGYPAPITNVLTGIGNISGDQAILRVNGTQAASNTADQGTGNFGNYPLYIGLRGGTTLPFNGLLYSLVVCGKLASAAEITATEAYINQKTRAY